MSPRETRKEKIKCVIVIPCNSPLVSDIVSFKMMSEGFLVGDGSWNLRVFVTDLQVERSLRVKGDLHIGGVMLRLVEDLGEHSPPTQRSKCHVWLPAF